MLPLRKPKQAGVQPGGKRLARSVNRVELMVAEAAASYSASEYHCPPQKPRIKPATPCPRVWKASEANDALRLAIRNERVSEAWEDGFPRYVWHRDGETIYEARHTRGPHGTYHAYPIEAADAPRGLIL